MTDNQPDTPEQPSGKPLKHWVTMFIAEYATNGENGLQAYLTVKPSVTPETAKVEASKLLTQPNVRSALQREYDRVSATSVATRENLITKANTIHAMAIDAKKLGNALQSIDLMAKMNGVYQDTTDKGHGYMQLIKSISVTVNNNTVNVTKPVDKCEVIDVESSNNSELGESVEKKHA